MKLDPEMIEWIENTISGLCYGEVSITFVVHEGQLVSVKKNIEQKEKLKGYSFCSHLTQIFSHLLFYFRMEFVQFLRIFSHLLGQSALFDSI